MGIVCPGRDKIHVFPMGSGVQAAIFLLVIVITCSVTLDKQAR